MDRWVGDVFDVCGYFVGIYLLVCKFSVGVVGGCDWFLVFL